MDIQLQFDSTLKILIENHDKFEVAECIKAMQFEDVFFHIMELDSEPFLRVYQSRTDYTAWAGYKSMHEQLKAMLVSYNNSPCANITIADITTLQKTYILFANGDTNDLYGVVFAKNNINSIKELHAQYKERGVPISTYLFKKGIIVPLEKGPNYFLNQH